MPLAYKTRGTRKIVPRKGRSLPTRPSSAVLRVVCTVRWNAYCSPQRMEHTTTQKDRSGEVPQDFSEFLSSAGDSAKAYAAAEKAYLGALVNDKLARLGSWVIVILLAAPPVLFSMLLGLIAGAKAWGQYLGNEALGYLCMSGAVFAHVLVFLLIGSSLKRWVQLQLFNTLHNDD